MTARDFLADLSRDPADFMRMYLAQGVLWADDSCRVSGTFSLILRNADASGASALIDHLIQSGVTMQAEVPRFINRYTNTCVLVLQNKYKPVQ